MEGIVSESVVDEYRLLVTSDITACDSKLDPL